MQVRLIGAAGQNPGTIENSAQLAVQMAYATQMTRVAVQSTRQSARKRRASKQDHAVLWIAQPPHYLLRGPQAGPSSPLKPRAAAP